MALKLNSAAFADNAKIPERHTCDGANLSPPLAWSGAPTGTRSFALICSDPDAPGGNWYHWAAYDIPPDVAALAEGRKAGGPGAPRQGINDFGHAGYGGPCPPHGHGTHRYRFMLYALKLERLPVAGPPHCRDVERMAKTNAIEQAALVGLYGR
jgi:Raf kinase inhibitor-like YbhB/YbcL family protein